MVCPPPFPRQEARPTTHRKTEKKKIETTFWQVKGSFLRCFGYINDFFQWTFAASSYSKKTVFRTRIRDPGSGAFLTPEYGIRDPGWVKKWISGSGVNIPDYNSDTLEQFFGSKYPNSLMRIRIRHPESFLPDPKAAKKKFAISLPPSPPLLFTGFSHAPLKQDKLQLSRAADAFISVILFTPASLAIYWKIKC